MKYPAVLIGTYHKTGTVWMQRLFKPAAKHLAIPFLETAPELPLEAGIYFEHHCRISEGIAAAARGFRMIRDPRDVVISGAHYHVKSDEPWLQIPRPRFGGKTYQQAITAEPGWLEKYRFEMKSNNTGGQTIRKMVLDQALECSVFRTVWYEALIDPIGGAAAFADLLDFLGFDAQETAVLTAQFDAGLLTNMVKKSPDHVRSGKVAQWKNIFTKSLAADFIALHGEALLALGYERDHSWANALPD